MPVSKAQQKAVTRYVKNKYDRFGLTMPKGHLDEIKAHAEAQGQSVNAYINAAIDERMAQETVESRTRAAEAEMMDTTKNENAVLGLSTGRTEGNREREE